MSELLGVVEFRQKLAALTEKLKDNETRQAFTSGARVIRDEVRRRAPAGKAIAYSALGSKRTFTRQRGALRRAVVAFSPKRSKEPQAFTRVNVFRGLNLAPHAHLVEFGTKARTPKTAKALFFRNASGTGWVSAKRVAGAPAQPFFRPSVEATGQRALDAIANKTAAILQKFIDRN